MTKAMQLAISIMLVLATGLLPATSAETKKKTLLAKISIPLTGNKTTFRFSVTNEGKVPAMVYGPFANLTRLVVVDPDGKKREIFNYKEGVNIAAKIAPGKELSWDVDIGQIIEFKREGEYGFSFTINGVESNRIVVVKD